MDKAIANIVHSLRRAKERYGVDLKKEDLDAILAQIKATVKCKRIHSDGDSLRRKTWLVEYDGREYVVVVENNKNAGRESIVTFLPN